MHRTGTQPKDARLCDAASHRATDPQNHKTREVEGGGENARGEAPQAVLGSMPLSPDGDGPNRTGTVPALSRFYGQEGHVPHSETATLGVSQHGQIDPQALADALAPALAEALRTQPPPPRLLTAQQLAEALQVQAAWVTANAGFLGGYALSDGERPRWRFDLQEAKERMRACVAGKRSPEREAASDGQHRRLRRSPADAVPNLAPIRPPKRGGGGR